MVHELEARNKRRFNYVAPNYNDCSLLGMENLFRAWLRRLKTAALCRTGVTIENVFHKRKTLGFHQTYVQETMERKRGEARARVRSFWEIEFVQMTWMRQARAPLGLTEVDKSEDSAIDSPRRRQTKHLLLLCFLSMPVRNSRSWHWQGIMSCPKKAKKKKKEDIKSASWHIFVFLHSVGFLKKKIMR